MQTGISPLKKENGSVQNAIIYKPMARNLTKKQKGFVKDFIKTGNGLQSALNNYDIKSPNKIDVAKSIATENLTKPSILNKIKSIAESIPDSLLIEKHLELLNSKEKIVAGGEVVSESINVQGVSKGLEMAYRLKGSYAEEKVKVNGEINIISFRGNHTNN